MGEVVHFDEYSSDERRGSVRFYSKKLGALVWGLIVAWWPGGNYTVEHGNGDREYVNEENIK